MPLTPPSSGGGGGGGYNILQTFSGNAASVEFKDLPDKKLIYEFFCSQGMQVTISKDNGATYLSGTYENGELYVDTTVEIGRAHV